MRELIKEYLPLLGPVIAITIFCYNQATRKRKHLHIEEVIRKGRSFQNIQCRLEYLRTIFRFRSIKAFSYKWLGNDFSGMCTFTTPAYEPPFPHERWSTHLVFQNAFTDEIKVADYEQPFRIHFKTAGYDSYRIVIMPVVTSPSNLQIQLHKTYDPTTGEPVLEVNPVLLNPGDSFTLKIVADHQYDYRLTYRIIGLKSNIFSKKRSIYWILRNSFTYTVMIRFCQIILFLAIYDFLTFNKKGTHAISAASLWKAAMIMAFIVICYIGIKLWSFLFNAEKVVRREVISGNMAGIEALHQFMQEEKWYERV